MAICSATIFCDNSDQGMKSIKISIKKNSIAIFSLFPVDKLQKDSE